jgi:BASS family bile acid:Na+ symporter
LVFGKGASMTQSLVLPALAFVMMISMSGVKGDLLRSPRTWINPLFTGLAMNYLVLGGIILLMNSILITGNSFNVGFILLAAVPPAVGVIPFTGFLEGDVEFSIIAVLGSYLSAFIITPLALYFLLGFQGDLQTRLIITMVQVIIVPLIVSRILILLELDTSISQVRSPLINWSFFLVIYTTVGLNHQVIVSNPLSLIPSALLAFVTTFLLGTILDRGGRLLRIDPKKNVCITLLGTSKNAGFAAGLALTLFSREAAIPMTVQTILMLAYVIYFDFSRARR